VQAVCQLVSAAVAYAYMYWSGVIVECNMKLLNTLTMQSSHVRALFCTLSHLSVSAWTSGTL